MRSRIFHIAANTFREAVRDRVLYNLIAFALLLTGTAILVGQISMQIERLVVINLGLTAVSLFGVVIAIFIGIGLVSKEIEKRTLYTVLSRPVARWEFIAGKFFAGTFAEDLRGFLGLSHGLQHWMATIAVYAIPNLSALNVISQVAHGNAVSGQLIFWNTAYTLVYTLAVLSGAILIFEHRNLK